MPFTTISPTPGQWDVSKGKRPDNKDQEMRHQSDPYWLFTAYGWQDEEIGRVDRDAWFTHNIFFSTRPQSRFFAIDATFSDSWPWTDQTLVPKRVAQENGACGCFRTRCWKMQWNRNYVNFAGVGARSQLSASRRSLIYVLYRYKWYNIYIVVIMFIHVYTSSL